MMRFSLQNVDFITSDNSKLRRALSLVMEWYGLHKDELMQDWESIRTTGEFKKNQPLE